MPVRRRTDNGHWLIDFRDSRGGRHRITLPEDQSGLTKRQAERQNSQGRPTPGARLRLVTGKSTGST